MTVAFYIIPMTEPPYSILHPQGPKYIDDIRCNWTGYNVDSMGVYVCQVNTTDEKHVELSKQSGVVRMAKWTDKLSSLAKTESDKITALCTTSDVAYDSKDTVGTFVNKLVAKDKAGYVWPGDKVAVGEY